MCTRAISPTAAAATASRPSKAPVGTWMRPPCRRASSTRSKLSSKAPQLKIMTTRPWLSAGSASSRKTAAGAHSTTMSASSHSRANGTTRGGTREIGHRRRRPHRVARRHRRQRQPFDPAIESPRDRRADRSKPANCHPCRGFRFDRDRHAHPTILVALVALTNFCERQARKQASSTKPIEVGGLPAV